MTKLEDYPMKVTSEKITPAIAFRMLENFNVGNRPLSERRVEGLVALMTGGLWQANGETIIISKTGRILDGQHRLTAVVRSGVTIEFLVVRDVDSAAFHTIDTGSPRTASQIAQMAGHTNTATAAAAAGLIWRMIRGTPAATKISTPYVLEVLKVYDGIEAWAGMASNKSAKSILTPTVMTAACVYLDSIAGRASLAADLYNGITTGSGLTTGNPVLALRNRLITYNGKRVVAALWPAVVRTINAMEAGDKLSRLHMTEDYGVVAAPKLMDKHFKHLSPKWRLPNLNPPANV